MENLSVEQPKTILITGGGGFIGKWLVRTLPVEAKIILIDSLDPQVHRFKSDFSEELKERATCIRADLRNPEEYEYLLEHVDVVVHLASQTGTGQSMYEVSKYVQHNVDGTAKLLEVLSRLERKPDRILLTSSRAVYGDGAVTDGSSIYYHCQRRLEDLKAGKWEVYSNTGNQLHPLPMKENHLPNPTSIYGLTKLWQEQLIESFAKNQEIDYLILRLQNVYGPEQELHNPYTGIVGIFTSLITEKGEIELFEDGKMARDFVFVKDVANAIARAVYHPEKLSEVVNVGSGKATTLDELVHTLSTALQKQVSINYSGRFRIGDIRHAVADTERYKSIFGEWSTTSLLEGVTQYLAWYKLQVPLSNQQLIDSFREMEDQKLLLRSQ